MGRTAFSLLVMLVLPLGGSWRAEPDQTDKSVRFLVDLQRADGGFAGTADAKKGSLKATAAAVRALKLHGKAPKDAEAVQRFVRACFDKEQSGFRDHPEAAGSLDVPTTAFGLLACLELGLRDGEREKAALGYLETKAQSFEERRIAVAAFEGLEAPPPKTWAKEVLDAVKKDGTWGDQDAPIATASAFVTLHRLGCKPPCEDAVRRCLRDGQEDEGGYSKDGSSDLESCYRVGRALRLLGDKPRDGKALLRFVDKCRNSDGGFGVAPGKPSSAAGTYFAAMLAQWFS